MTSPSSLGLLLPGLLGPWPQARETGFPLPETPALNRLLARAESVSLPVTGFEAELCERFGLRAHDTDLPIGALCRLADGGEPDDHYWLRADPVNLHADLRQVVLHDARHLAIDKAEAAGLCESFNHTFGADGLRLEAPRPERWYLRCDRAPTLRTASLIRAAGRDINPLLPTGADARRWNALLTEVQMLFHDHPVNQTREAAGRPLINGLWVWGGGRLPARLDPPGIGFYDNGTLGRGLARHAGLAVQPLPADATDWLEARGDETDSLLVFESLRWLVADADPFDWQARLDRLERDWFAPLLAVLRRGRVRQLELHPGDGRVLRVDRRGLRRFWRRPQPLSSWLMVP